MIKDFQTILFQTENNIATLTLNRPDAANGINPTLANELAQAAMICDNDTTIRCVIITGSGRFFCAGGDLKAMSASDNPKMTLKGMADDLHKATSLFARMDKPTIVAVNGIAAGAGFSIAIAGDFVIAAQSAKFTMAYTAAGLSPDGSSTYYLPRLIGIRRAMELMITNRRITAQEAVDWNLINRVVADDAVLSTAQKLAHQIASGPVDAFGIVKKLLLCSFNNSLETQMELEGRAISECAISANGREGIQAFLEKRQPNFT